MSTASAVVPAPGDREGRATGHADRHARVVHPSDHTYLVDVFAIFLNDADRKQSLRQLGETAIRGELLDIDKISTDVMAAHCTSLIGVHVRAGITHGWIDYINKQIYNKIIWL